MLKEDKRDFSPYDSKYKNTIRIIYFRNIPHLLDKMMRTEDSDFKVTFPL